MESTHATALGRAVLRGRQRGVRPPVTGGDDRLRGVRKVYEPDVVALDGVSFVIDKGEFVFVVGASGSGKSTIVRLLLKELELDGRADHRRRPRPGPPETLEGALLRRNVGCVFQDFKLLRDRHRLRKRRLRAEGAGRADGRDSSEGARGAQPRRPGAQDELEAGRALRRRAAARLHARAVVNHRRCWSATSPRQPRPGHVRRDHAASTRSTGPGRRS